MIKLYLVMSCQSWSNMHLNYTSVLFWLFSSLNDLFFLHSDWYLWRKISIVALEKCNSVAWLFNYHFCLSNLFCQKGKSIYNPVFPDFSFSFLRQYWLLQMNQLETWVYTCKLEIWNSNWFLQLLFMLQAFLNSPAIFIYQCFLAFYFLTFQSQYCHCFFS